MVWVDQSYFALRRRYRRAGVMGSVIAVALAAFHLVPSVHGADQPMVVPGGWDLTSAAILLLLAAIVPPMIAGLCWRLHRRYHVAHA